MDYVRTSWDDGKLCERQIEAIQEAKSKECHRSFVCRVTIVEARESDSGDGRATRECHGLGYFTLDEDF